VKTAMKRKLRLLNALDAIIADMREATAAIQRDDYDGAVEKFHEVNQAIIAEAEELGRAA